MEFRKYQHIARLNTVETDGILDGTVYIFPKLDGCNCSVWMDDGALCAGSRNRQLTKDNDHQKFYQHVINNDNFYKFFSVFPDHKLYGEWLVPHTIKEYRDTAWQKFYIFDVINEEGYLKYDDYAPMMKEFELFFIPCLSTIQNANEKILQYEVDHNFFLMNDGAGPGEGIVIKNYDYTNKFGRKTWAKMVKNKFKDANAIHNKPAKKGGIPLESKIASQFCTKHLVDKVYANIVNMEGDWRSRYIQRLIGTVFHDMVTEEIWNIVKKFKNPTINFKLLYRHVTSQVKELKSDVFT